MVNFIIADFVARLNIAKSQHMKSIIISYSKIILTLLKMFEDLGIIRGYFVLDQYKIEVYLKYNQSKSVFSNIKIVSKPSRRVYVDMIKLKKFKNKYEGEILIMSTNEGYLFDLECIRRNIGGEIVLRIII